MVTLEEIKEWLRIDSSDDDSILSSLINVSKAKIKAATGVPSTYENNLNPADLEDVKEMYKMAQRIIITDLYNERDIENKALISTYIQLELEYRRCLIVEN